MLRILVKENILKNFVIFYSIIAINVYCDPPENLQLSSNTIEEGKPVGTIVGTFIPTDPDYHESFTYSLVSGAGDDDNNSFSIDGIRLKSKKIFNYSEKEDYFIRVRVYDKDKNGFEKALTIKIIGGKTQKELVNNLQLNSKGKENPLQKKQSNQKKSPASKQDSNKVSKKPITFDLSSTGAKISISIKDVMLNFQVKCDKDILIGGTHCFKWELNSQDEISKIGRYDNVGSIPSEFAIPISKSSENIYCYPGSKLISEMGGVLLNIDTNNISQTSVYFIYGDMFHKGDLQDKSITLQDGIFELKEGEYHFTIRYELNGNCGFRDKKEKKVIYPDNVYEGSIKKDFVLKIKDGQLQLFENKN